MKKLQVRSGRSAWLAPDVKMTAPARYGGYEADFQTQCDVLAEIARGCPSTSWVATILSAMSWLAGVFPDEAQDEIFRDPKKQTG